MTAPLPRKTSNNLLKRLTTTLSRLFVKRVKQDHKDGHFDHNAIFQAIILDSFLEAMNTMATPISKSPRLHQDNDQSHKHGSYDKHLLVDEDMGADDLVDDINDENGLETSIYRLRGYSKALEIKLSGKRTQKLMMQIVTINIIIQTLEKIKKHYVKQHADLNQLKSAIKQAIKNNASQIEQLAQQQLTSYLPHKHNPINHVQPSTKELATSTRSTKHQPLSQQPVTANDVPPFQNTDVDHKESHSGTQELPTTREKLTPQLLAKQQQKINLGHNLRQTTTANPSIDGKLNPETMRPPQNPATTMPPSLHSILPQSFLIGAPVFPSTNNRSRKGNRLTKTRYRYSSTEPVLPHTPLRKPSAAQVFRQAKLGLGYY